MQVTMTPTRKTYFSTLNNTTVNKGVEAKENEINDIRHVSKYNPEQEQSVLIATSGIVTECSERRAGGDAHVAPSPTSVSEQSGSYVKGCGDTSNLPAAVLLSCPALAALHQHSLHKHGLADNWKQTEKSFASSNFGAEIVNDKVQQKYFQKSLWSKLRCADRHDLEIVSGPERIEIYHFERTSDYLCARDTTKPTRVERTARHIQRPLAALLAELLAVPRLLLSASLAVLLQIERCVLLGARNAMTGFVQIMSDQMLKPTLALMFNALVQPPLVFATQTFGALRDALRPLTLAVADAAEPLVRLLSSIRIVHVERRCACEHQV